jgi:type IV secretory pathway TraG/TraD family ATPase VirD4
MPEDIIAVAASKQGESSSFSSLISDSPLLPLSLLLGIVVGCGVLSRYHQKGKVATARSAKAAEKNAAARLAEQQLKARIYNEITLYAGTPVEPLLGMGRRRTLWVPNAQEGIAVCGGPGKGKSFSVIDPLIRSAIDQRHPTIVYDFKGEQLRRHAAYAAQRGYQVYVFAPGKPWSGVINPIDLVKAADDPAIMSKQLAQVFNLNTHGLGSGGQKNEYFADASNLLIQTLLLMSKDTPFPDLLMSWSILSLPNLAKRMLLAVEQQWIDIWTEVSATSLTSIAEAEVTVGGVISTAVNTMAPLISRQFVSCLCGETTIPLEMTGKTLLFFQLDQMTRDVVAPLLASILHLVVLKNLSKRRNEPLVLAMDEFPTIFLPDIVKWINEYRENGLVTILGFQNYSQLEYKYGRELSRAILGACATKFIFNPQDVNTAEEYSRFCGEEDVVLNTRSQSYGRSSGYSHSEQYHRRPLYSARDILTLPKGWSIFINPAYASRQEAALPWLLRAQIPKRDQQAEAKSKELWDRKVCQRLIERASKLQIPLDEELLRAELVNRKQFANYTLLPGALGAEYVGTEEDEVEQEMEQQDQEQAPQVAESA